MNWIYTVIISVTLFIQACSTQKDCKTRFHDPAVSLINAHESLDEFYKAVETEKKTALLNQFCEVLVDAKKVLIIERVVRDPNSTLGLIYDFDNDEIYTYQMKQKKISISSGTEYDKFGSLERFLETLRDSTVLKMEKLKLENLNKPDKSPVLVMYFNVDSAIHKLVTL